MNGLRTRYEIAFAVIAVGLAVGALVAFNELGPSARHRKTPPPWMSSRGVITRGPDEYILAGARAIAATEADYRRFATEDAAWRQRHARMPDLFLMKRRALEDRVYVLTTAGRRGDAIKELEEWTARYPGDREAVLWLARLLREAGRTNESLARYRQLLMLSEHRR
jgi:hypothetical protein